MRVVDGYELRRELARGGMGVVHEAVEVATGRRVALKRMLQAFTGDPEAVARFLIEAQATARLRHPGVVTVHPAGRAGGAPYLVMELVEGESLQRRLDRDGPLAPDEALTLAERLADALAHAHAAGVLRRDLKPSNVLIDGAGQARVTDFGLARLLDAPTRERLTRTGELVGTPAFMAPEQADGHGVVDERADVYGLGATLFAALTGRAPFEGTSPLATIHAVLTRPPRAPSSLRPGLPPPIDALVLRCLAKDPAARPASMAELGRAIRAARAGEGARRRGAPWLLAASGAAVVLGGVALAAFATVTRSPASGPTPTRTPSPVKGSAPSAPPPAEPAPAPPTEPPVAADQPPSPAPPVDEPSRPRRPLTDDEIDRLVPLPGDRDRQAEVTDDLVEEIAARRPDNALVLLRRVQRRHGRGELQAALEDCQRAIEMFREVNDKKRLEHAHQLHWLVLDALGRREEAVAALDAAVEELPENVHLRWDRATLRSMRRLDGDLEQAIADLEFVVTNDPQQRVAAAVRGRQLVEGLKGPERARSWLRERAEGTRDHGVLVTYAEELSSAFVDVDPSVFREALRLLDEALALERSAALLRARAKVCMRAQDLDQAIEDLRAAVDLAKGDPFVLLELAASLHAGGRLDEAWKEADRAVEASGDRAGVLRRAVELLTKGGAWQRALEVAERWLVAWPDDAEAARAVEELRSRVEETGTGR